MNWFLRTILSILKTKGDFLLLQSQWQQPKISYEKCLMQRRKKRMTQKTAKEPKRKFLTCRFCGQRIYEDKHDTAESYLHRHVRYEHRKELAALHQESVDKMPNDLNL